MRGQTKRWMKPARREALILGGAGVAATAAGFLVGPMLLRSTKEEGGAENTGGGNFRSAAFPDLAGNRRKLGEWQGRILVCNFWATWCAPCREEIPLLVAARKKYAPTGLEVVGIAVDNAAKVRDFTSSFTISYPILLAEAEGLDLMRKLGNSAGGLPYTVIADRNGGIVHRKLGAFRQGDLDAILAPLTRA